MKKLVAVLMALLIVASVVACTPKNEGTPTKPNVPTEGSPTNPEVPGGSEGTPVESKPEASITTNNGVIELPRDEF